MQHSGTSHKGLIFGGLMAETLIFLRSLHAMRFPTAVWWFSCSVVEQKSINLNYLYFLSELLLKTNNAKPPDEGGGGGGQSILTV